VGAGSSGRTARTARSVDRLINFSDAVVAVAVTLMALPLVDIAGPADGETVWTLLRENGPQIGTFLFTFYVVAIMWLAHNRILNSIVDYDGPLFWLNTSWLVAIVLLPWVSELSGSASRTDGGVDFLYWSTLALISVLAGAMAWHIRRTPRLLDEGEARSDRRSIGRGLIFAGYFMLIAVASIVVPSAVSWLPLGIIPLSIWLHPAREDQPPSLHDAAEETT
jgi:uncharacterized membrane protein